MSEIVRLKTQTQIDNEAALWTWRLDSGPLTAAEQAELDGWLRLDYRHRHAFEELRSTWRAHDRLAERPPDEEPAALARPETRRIFSGRKRYWQAAAAAMLVVALGTTLWV